MDKTQGNLNDPYQMNVTIDSLEHILFGDVKNRSRDRYTSGANGRSVAW